MDENLLEFASATSDYKYIADYDFKNFTYWAPKCKGEISLKPSNGLAIISR